jgi:hypothetical protein
MKSLNTLARWIVVSSANPAEISLTIKGVLIGIIPNAMLLVGLAHLNVGQDQLTLLFDAVANLVQAVLTAVASVMTVYGLARKLWNTIKAHQGVQTTP